MLVVDTCVLIDIADDDPSFGQLSALCLTAHLEKGLLVSPISYVEMAPVFDGSARLLDEFLEGIGVSHEATFDLSDRSRAFAAWARHVTAKRSRRSRKRPVADALIGALAVRHKGLITRNTKHFSSFYPQLQIVDPISWESGQSS